MKADPHFLTVEQVVAIHERNLAEHGGEAGIKDPGLIQSAVANVYATFGGAFLHPTIPDMAAAYWFGLTNNHAFVDGNKRTGLRAAEVFLNINGYGLRFTEATAEAITMEIAAGRMTREDLAGYLRTNVCLTPISGDSEEICDAALVWDEFSS